MKNVNKSQSYCKGITHSSNTLRGMIASRMHWEWLGKTCVNHQEYRVPLQKQHNEEMQHTTKTKKWLMKLKNHSLTSKNHVCVESPHYV